MSLKRILNELHNIIPQKLLDNNLYNKFYFIEIGNNIICREIGVINNKTGNLEINFYINDNYPFNPPSINLYFNKYKISYSSWLSLIIDYKNYQYDKYANAWIFSIIRWPMLRKYLKYPKKGICYCCESISCYNKWYPGCNLSDILLEYIIIKQFNIYTNYLNQKCINSIFYNEKWSLSQDLIFHILSFV